MVGMALAKSLYTLPTWTRTVALVSADFRAAVSTLGSGEVEAESAACPPGDGGVGGESGAAQDG